MTSEKKSHHEDGVKRTVDAFLETGKREGHEHTLRLAEAYGRADVEKIKSAVKKVDSASHVAVDLEHHNVHIISNTPPEKFATSLAWAGYEVLEVF